MVQEQGGIWPSLVLYINIHLSPEKLTRGGMVGLQGLVWWGIKSSIPHCGDHIYHTYHTTYLCGLGTKLSHHIHWPTDRGLKYNMLVGVVGDQSISPHIRGYHKNVHKLHSHQTAV